MSKKNSKNNSLWNNPPISGDSSTQTDTPEEMAKKANEKSARNKRSH